MLMHPKDKVSSDQKKDLVYHWECKADGCNSSYIGETSRALGERVKEQVKSSPRVKSTTSAILKHCKDFHHPLPSIDDFNIIDKEPSQITWEAKEAIHIRWLDPSLNRNIGKMSIPHCFDNLLGAKPRHLIGTVYPNIPLSSASLHSHPQSSLGATLGVRMSVTAYGNLSTMSCVWPIGTSRLNLRPCPLSI